MGAHFGRGSLAAAFLLALPASEGIARGQAHPQPADACLTAPVDGQKLRRADKLLEARDSFSTCARRSCPARIVQECTRWLHEVDDILPSIVAVVHDASGNDVLDAQVSIDDQPAADLGARAIPLNPGPHKLVFRKQGDSDVQQDVVLREGEKARSIMVILKPPALPVPPALPPPKPTTIAERPIPLVVWILGGVAVVGAAGFATFGTLGVVERGNDCGVVGCTQTQKDSIETKFRIGDVSLAVGVASLVGAGVVFFTRPTVEKPAPAAILRLQPTDGGARVVLGAHF